ncbi:acyl carrier protein [Bacillus timonensis]|uniref:Acyl carrier protein n=1 Tax=Bacillus timonensis TaxID=1033734 RepID=A0A4S3PMI2_9BACI|nr:phosphopantetheine-binding protein [Bacillus timonensis]THE10618.1 acyl carrier protein [Bacillus timonensis]
MTFNNFTATMFDLLEQEQVEVSEETNLRDELDVDSLQMVNLTTMLADHYKVSFSNFIENADKTATVGGLYSIVKEGLSK